MVDVQSAPETGVPTATTVAPNDGSLSVIPEWIAYGLLVVVAVLVAFGGVGLLLADIGIYKFPLVLLGAIPLVVAFFALAKVGRWPRAGRKARLAAAAAVLIAIAFGVGNIRDTGQHVLQDRDPGVYLNTARYVEQHGTLEVPFVTGPFAASRSVRVNTPGLYAEVGGDGEFQFNHFLPVVAAEAYRVGGVGSMTRVPDFLVALGLLTFYAAAAVFTRRPFLAVGAMLVLGFSMPILAVARDMYSESSTFVLLWAALWLWLVAIKTRRPGLALLGGLALGATVMTRVDAVIYLVPVPLAITYEWIRSRREEPSTARQLRWTLFAFVVGIVPPAVLGTVDVVVRSSGYYDALKGEIKSLWAALVVTGLVAGLIVIGVVRGWKVREGLSRHRHHLAWTLAGLVLAAGLLGWLVRPEVSKVTRQSVPAVADFVAAVQRANGLPLEPTRLYSEQSLRWMAWYLGDATVALAIVGAALVGYRMIVGRRRQDLLLPLVIGLPTAFYLWDPSISPDQIWAARRFVPAILPGLCLFAVIAVGAIVGYLARRWPARHLAVGVSVVLVGTMVVSSAAASWPVRRFSEQAGFLAPVDAMCATIGTKAAVVVLPGDNLDATLLQPIRSWCNAPAAAARPTADRNGIKALARTWSSQGRQLWVAASDPETITTLLPEAKPTLVQPAENNRHLERTLTTRPNAYAPQNLNIALAPVAAT